MLILSSNQHLSSQFTMVEFLDFHFLAYEKRFIYDPDYVPKGHAMLFHPDILFGTELGRKMQGYSFSPVLVTSRCICWPRKRE